MSVHQSGLTTVSSGGVSASIAIITGTTGFPSTYAVTIGTSWITDVNLTTKTTTGFLVNFAVPAPAGGGTLGWLIHAN